MSSNKSNIKFTVIVPTRERCETLEWTLKTCVTQDYDNLEIIVSDNLSQDATRDVVETYKDKRIRYVNPGKRLSMSHNWEFALSYATGDYIAFVGDDDGLMPNGVEYAAEFLSETKTDAFICRKPLYYWANMLSEEYRNILVLYLKDSLEKLDSVEMLKKITTFETLDKAPLIYDGFVKKEILDKIKNMSGRFFNSQIPDVYSSIAILGVIPDYYYTTKPFLIQGISSKSTGASYLGQGGTEHSAKQFYSEENIPFHSKLITSPSSYTLMAESILQAKDNVETNADYNFDEKVLIEKTMESAVAMSPEKYQEVVNSVKFSGETYQLQDYAEKMIEKYPNATASRVPFKMGYNFRKDTLAINTDETKVSNIYQASLECDKIRKKLPATAYLKNSLRYIAETAKQSIAKA